MSHDAKLFYLKDHNTDIGKEKTISKERRHALSKLIHDFSSESDRVRVLREHTLLYFLFPF